MTIAGLESPTPKSARRLGIRSATALLPAVGPLGIALGVALSAFSVNRFVMWLAAPVLVAGSAQLVLFTQLDGGASVLAAAAAAIVLNARFVVYGAALAERLVVGQPRWFRWIAAHYVVDQTYAMTLADGRVDMSPRSFRQYFLTAGTILSLTWTASVGLGLVAGPILPSALPVELVLAATFVALVVPGVAGGRGVIAVLAGAGLAITQLGTSTTFVVAAVAGAVVGVARNKESAT